MIVRAAAALACLALTGCGGAAASGDGWTDAQIADALGLRRDAFGLAWTTRGGCDVTVILNDAREVASHEDARSQAVVTNSAGTAGVWVQRTDDCRREVERGLRRLE